MKRTSYTIAFLLIATAAHAADVTIPYGDWIKAFGDILGSIAVPAAATAIAWILTTLKLPAPITNFIQTLLADQLLSKALSWGINAVEGATAGRVLNIKIANDVVAQAVQYVVSHGPGWLVDWMGGPDAIRQKIIARMNLPSSMSVTGSVVVGPSASTPTSP